MRVNIDQLSGNEMGDPRDLTHNSLNQNCTEDMVTQRNLAIRYLKYDITPLNCIQMILCELGHGRLSPVSVPVVIKEFEIDAAASRT